MSLILCLSPAYQPLLCGLVGRDVCVPHFVSLTGVPAYIVRSCRERRVCPSFCASHWRTSLLCGLVGRDVCVPHFHIFVSLTVYQPFVRSCMGVHFFRVFMFYFFINAL